MEISALLGNFISIKINRNVERKNKTQKEKKNGGEWALNLFF